MTLDELSVLLDGIAPVVHEELVERDAKIAALEHRLAALEAHCAEARAAQSTPSIAEVSREALQAALDRRGAR
jgi:hypothetical protein